MRITKQVIVLSLVVSLATAFALWFFIISPLGSEARENQQNYTRCSQYSEELRILLEEERQTTKELKQHLLEREKMNENCVSDLEEKTDIYNDCKKKLGDVISDRDTVDIHLQELQKHYDAKEESLKRCEEISQDVFEKLWLSEENLANLNKTQLQCDADNQENIILLEELSFDLDTCIDSFENEQKSFKSVNDEFKKLKHKFNALTIENELCIERIEKMENLNVDDDDDLDFSYSEDEPETSIKSVFLNQFESTGEEIDFYTTDQVELNYSSADNEENEEEEDNNPEDSTEYDYQDDDETTNANLHALFNMLHPSDEY